MTTISLLGIFGIKNTDAAVTPYKQKVADSAQKLQKAAKKAKKRVKKIDKYGR